MYFPHFSSDLLLPLSLVQQLSAHNQQIFWVVSSRNLETFYSFLYSLFNYWTSISGLIFYFNLKQYRVKQSAKSRCMGEGDTLCTTVRSICNIVVWQSAVTGAVGTQTLSSSFSHLLYRYHQYTTADNIHTHQQYKWVYLLKQQAFTQYVFCFSTEEKHPESTTEKISTLNWSLSLC